MKIGTQEWNNTMYSQHATPYSGIAGWIEKCRVKKILQLANLKESDSLLEVGCEAGNLLVEFPKCKRTVGFDISDSALADAKLLFQKRKKDAEFVQGDACRPLPFSTGEFTVIVCSEMLEHVPDPEICLKIASLCNEDTKVIISVPNEKPKLKAKKFSKASDCSALYFRPLKNPRVNGTFSASTRIFLIGLLIRFLFKKNS
jgi:2-polyprenyl-3-methyl-5-hydroxy-6-metoxy-1,4-benzoquinol methylase